LRGLNLYTESLSRLSGGRYWWRTWQLFVSILSNSETSALLKTSQIAATLLSQ